MVSNDAEHALVEAVVLSYGVGAERLDLLVQVCGLSADVMLQNARRKSTVLNESITERSLSGEYVEGARRKSAIAAS